MKRGAKADQLCERSSSRVRQVREVRTAELHRMQLRSNYHMSQLVVVQEDEADYDREGDSRDSMLTTPSSASVRCQCSQKLKKNGRKKKCSLKSMVMSVLPNSWPMKYVATFYAQNSCFLGFFMPK